MAYRGQKVQTDDQLVKSFRTVMQLLVQPLVCERKGPHTRTVLPSVLSAHAKLPSSLSLACETFYHTRALKPEEYRSVWCVI